MRNDNSYLTRMKVALATGGLVATFIGAGLLGNQAGSLAATTTNVVNTSAVVVSETTTTNGPTTIEALDLPELDFQLEAIPTVTAPQVRVAPLTFGRSSS